LNGEVFNTLREAQVLIEEWRRHSNRVRPHSSLGYRPPAPEALANAEGGKTVPMARSQSSLGAGAAVMAHQNSAWITRWGRVNRSAAKTPGNLPLSAAARLVESGTPQETGG
jgi:hypothetical protein